VGVEASRVRLMIIGRRRSRTMTKQLQHRRNGPYRRSFHQLRLIVIDVCRSTEFTG